MPQNKQYRTVYILFLWFKCSPFCILFSNILYVLTNNGECHGVVARTQKFFFWGSEKDPFKSWTTLHLREQFAPEKLQVDSSLAQI